MNFLERYRDNQCEITWFIIGWLSLATLDCLARGNYGLALFDAGLVCFNYYIWKNR